jgi:hypothetical protein
MRGFLLSSLASLFGGTRLAIIAAVVVPRFSFALLHHPQRLYGVVPRP